MNFLTILALALALAMDAFAVSLATGIRLRSVSVAQTLRMAGVFGGMQFAMPLAGWVLGMGAEKYVQAYDHWLAFGLLTFVAFRMLKEVWENRGKSENECSFADPTRGSSLWLLGIATSIDALAVGLSLAFLNYDVFVPSVVIGLVCFFLTATGMHLGQKIYSIPSLCSLGNKATVGGAVVLLLIGFNILREHGVFV